MKPTDIRDANWSDIRAQLTGRRQAVHDALLRHGPLTTRDLAHAMYTTEISIRPRVTELVQIGLAALAGREGREGVYRAIPLDQALAAHRHRADTAAAAEQMHLRFG